MEIQVICVDDEIRELAAEGYSAERIAEELELPADLMEYIMRKMNTWECDRCHSDYENDGDVPRCDYCGWCESCECECRLEGV